MSDKYNNQLLAKLSEVYAQHEEGEVFVTEKVSFMMRQVTKRARKNYLGIYDEPYDPITGEEKYWPPLTESFVDGVKKSVDFDLNQVDVYSTDGSKVAATRVFKLVLRQKLREAGFSSAVNEFRDRMIIDGTGTLKFIDTYDAVEKKRVMRIRAVDEMNIVADQSAESLDDCFGVLERVLMNQDEVRAQSKRWDKEATKELIKKGGQKQFQRSSFSVASGEYIQSASPVYEIWDYWGQVEKSWITEKEEDEGIWTEGHVVTANLKGKNGQILFKELNKKMVRPYVDAPLKKVIGRRQGRGVPEQLFGTQKYMNMLMEIRKKNAQILQNGLFTATRSMGMTADSILSKLATGGIVLVNEQGDFQQLPVQDSRPSSYQDEDRLLSWGERNTGQYDVRRGEALAASAPATTQLIQDRNTRDLYNMVHENVTLALEKFLKRHVVPWVVDNVKDGEIVNIVGSMQELQEFDNAVAEHLVNKQFTEFVEKNRRFPKPEDLVEAKRKQLEALSRQGSRRYIEVKKDMFRGTSVGVNVIMNSEMVDKNLLVTKLQEILTLSVTNPGTLSLDPQGIIDTIFDTLGIQTDRIYSNRMIQPSPIDRIADALQAQQQQAPPSQELNALTGRVAPNISSQTIPAGVNRNDTTTQTDVNTTLTV